MRCTSCNVKTLKFYSETKLTHETLDSHMWKIVARNKTVERIPSDFINGGHVLLSSFFTVINLLNFFFFTPSKVDLKLYWRQHWAACVIDLFLRRNKCSSGHYCNQITSIVTSLSLWKHFKLINSLNGRYDDKE